MKATTQLFINPDQNLIDKSSQDYLTLVNLSKKEVSTRWSNSRGQEILAALKGNQFSREVLQKEVGQVYGKYDLRGIPLEGSELPRKDLSGCDFYSANLQGCNFTKSDLNNSLFSEANIKGAIFDWCQVEGIYVDNVDFDYRTSFRGVDLSKINFNLAALLREAAIGQQIIAELEDNHKILALVLKLTSNYGRSFGRFASWCLALTIFFALLYWLIPQATNANGLLESFYFSIITFTTLGFGDILPTSALGKILVILEVIAGYFMMGLLIAILTRKVLH